MKKKLALLLAAVMCLQPLAALSISAEGESAVEKVYADVYGVEIDFATADAATAAQSSISLAEKEGGAAVAVTATVSTDVETKVVVTPDNSELLDVDTPYTLTIGDETKDFQIKTMFYEDFEDLGSTYTVPTLTPEEIAGGAVVPLPGEDIAVSKDFSNNYGKYSLTAGTGGAFVRKVGGDTEVGVTDGAFAITDIDTFENLADATLMADIKGYGKNSYNSSGTSALSPGVLCKTIFLSRAYSTTDGGYEKAAKALYQRGKTSVGMIETDLYDFRSDTSGGEMSAEISGYVCIDDMDPNDPPLSSGLWRYEHGKTQDYRNDTSLTLAQKIIVGKDTPVTSPSNERKLALRTNGKTLTNYASGSPLVYASDEIVIPQEGDDIDFVIGLNEDSKGLAVIDNVRVTIYTEDLSPAPTGTISEPVLDGDTTKLTLDFNEELTGIGPVTLDTITVLEDGFEVDKTITVDETDKSILNIVPDGLAADKTYTVIIPQGFGVADLRVEEATGFSLEKYIAPIPMAITDKALTPTSINITFDKDISAMTTTEDGYITVYTKVLGADDSTYTVIPYADITFTKEGNVLKIAPDTFAVDNTYKVVVAQGYGDTNTKITAETAEEYVVDFVKIELIPTKVTGNLGLVMVEFDRPIDSSITAANIAENVKIFNAQTGAQQTATPTVANGILNVTFPTMEKNVEYEIFIGEGFGTNVVGTKKDFRKKFVQEIVASEDFEGETVGATVPGAKSAVVQADRWDLSPTPNHRGHMGSARFAFTTSTTYNEDGTVKTLGTEELENLTLEFKHQSLFPIRDNTASSAKKYNQGFTFDIIRVNMVNDNNYNWLYINGSSVLLRDKINGDTNLASGGLNYEKSGDAYKMPDGTLFVYNQGEEFASADPNYPYTGLVKNTAGADVTASSMDPKDGNVIRIVKTGNVISMFVKSATTGEFVQKIAPTTMVSTQKKGSIIYTGNGTNWYSLDDIEISAFKVFEETGLTVAASTITPTGGDWTTATEATGEITLANYTDGDKDMAVVAVAYGANGKMLGAYYNDTVSGVAAGGRENVSFSLANLGGEAVSVKVFVWDNTTNRAPMTVRELIATE